MSLFILVIQIFNSSFMQKEHQSGKFLRVGKSEMLETLKDGDATVKAIRNNKYIYIDFDDQRHIKILDRANPHDSDQQAQLIGTSLISGINKLSGKTYQMLKYLSQTKHLKEKRKNIDAVVNNRIDKQPNNSYSFDERQLFSNKNITSAKLQQFLQGRKNQRMFKKLEQGQKELQRSISDVSSYRKNKIVNEDRPHARGFKLPPLMRLRNALQR